LKRTIGFLRLTRPANVVTSVSDVLAGIAISGFLVGWMYAWFHITWILLMCFSTACLYAGGIVFNDVFDADLDKLERPERPIPSGLISSSSAATFGAILLIVGIIAALRVNYTSALIAASIAIIALVYNKWGKHYSFVGPINMGMCRGLNLLLGISIIPDAIQTWTYIAYVPVIYIAAITMISRGEVHGGNKSTLYFAAVLYAAVISFILYLAFVNETVGFTLIFLLFFAWMIYRPLFKAIADPVGKNIGKAVKAGVIALIIMNAAWATAAGAFYAGLAIMVLLPLSLWLGRKFAVT
jgi:4-hydroxybenzoate polyprenyltransferase